MAVGPYAVNVLMIDRMNLAFGDSVFLICGFHVNRTLKAVNKFELIFMPVGKEFFYMKKLRLKGLIILVFQLVIVESHGYYDTTKVVYSQILDKKHLL